MFNDIKQMENNMRKGYTMYKGNRKSTREGWLPFPIIFYNKKYRTKKSPLTELFWKIFHPNFSLVKIMCQSLLDFSRSKSVFGIVFSQIPIVTILYPHRKRVS